MAPILKHQKNGAFAHYVRMMQQTVNKHTGRNDRALHLFILRIPEHDTHMIIGCSFINTYR